MTKPECTLKEQELIKNVLEILKKNNRTSTISKAFRSFDNGMKCTCQGMNPDSKCPVHRVID